MDLFEFDFRCQVTFVVIMIYISMAESNLEYLGTIFIQVNYLEDK